MSKKKKNANPSTPKFSSLETKIFYQLLDQEIGFSDIQDFSKTISFAKIVETKIANVAKASYLANVISWQHAENGAYDQVEFFVNMYHKCHEYIFKAMHLTKMYLFT